MQFKIYRDIDARLRLRKLVVELYYQGELLERTRMFCPLFRFRLKRKLAHRMRHMERRGQIYLIAMGK